MITETVETLESVAGRRVRASMVAGVGIDAIEYCPVTRVMDVYLEDGTVGTYERVSRDEFSALIMSGHPWQFIREKLAQKPGGAWL